MKEEPEPLGFSVRIFRRESPNRVETLAIRRPSLPLAIAAIRSTPGAVWGDVTADGQPFACMVLSRTSDRDLWTLAEFFAGHAEPQGPYTEEQTRNV